MLPGRSLEAAGNRRPRGMIAARLFGNRIRLTATPDAQKGAYMPEKPVDDEQTKNQEGTSTSRASGRGRKLFRWGLVLLVCAVVFLFFGRDYLSSTIRSAKRAVSDRPLGPFFTRVPADQLLSSENVLRAVGRSPVDPGRVLTPQLEQVGTLQPEKKPSPDTAEPPDRIAEDKRVPTGEERKEPRAPTVPPPAARSSPPAVEVRAPAPPVAPPPDTEPEKKESPQTQEPLPKPPAPEGQGPTPTIGRFEDRDKAARTAAKGSKKAGRDDTNTTNAPVSALEAPRTDQFQLPGSLVIKISNYSGTVPKWGLMVILDDSATMAKKLRGWNPNRMQAAAEILKTVPDALETGSKISIRDFTCPNREGKPAKGQTACLSHTLYEWAAAPLKGISEKLDQNTPSGSTNPCAAAAYSLKKDFGSLGTLAPRVLIITDGAHRCAFKEVLSEADRKTAKEKIPVDVLALGMHRKRQVGYSKVAERTGGLFLRIDNPSDLQSGLAKYIKLLKTPVKEKIEVRGEKAVLTARPDEELTVVPGSYTIVLPAVAGIAPSKRSLDPVQIQSGESTVVQVKVNKKGRPLAKIEPAAKAGQK
jgi:hypothetical protein